MQNKSAILNPKLDNGEAYRKYMAGYQDQLALTNESKSAQKSKEQLGKLKFNKDFNYVFDDPNIIKDIESDDLPIGHPDRKALDITTSAMPPKPIGTKEKEDFSKYVVGEIKPDKIPGTPINMGGFQTQTPITSTYSDQNKQVFGQRAADVYDTDRSWRSYADKLFKETMHDPIKYEKLNNIFKKHYGGEIDTPKEAFMAETILDHDIKTLEYQKGKDEFAMQKALMAMRQANAKELIKYKKDLDPSDQDMNDLWVTTYVDKLKNEALGRQPSPYKYAFGVTSQEYDIPVDPVLGKALSVGSVEPDAVRVDKDGKFRRIFYKRYQKGDVIPSGKSEGDIVTGAGGKAAVDETLSRPQLTQDQIELALGKRALTGKQLNKQMVNTITGGSAQSSNRKYNINGKTYSHDQLRKMYPEEKIKEYIDAGIIK